MADCLSEPRNVAGLSKTEEIFVIISLVVDTTFLFTNQCLSQNLLYPFIWCKLQSRQKAKFQSKWLKSGMQDKYAVLAAALRPVGTDFILFMLMYGSFAKIKPKNEDLIVIAFTWNTLGNKHVKKSNTPLWPFV